MPGINGFGFLKQSLAASIENARLRLDSSPETVQRKMTIGPSNFHIAGVHLRPDRVLTHDRCAIPLVLVMGML